MNTSNIQSDRSETALIARQAHLSLLGVKQWYSKYRLTHAGKTPEAMFAKPGNVGGELLSKKPCLLGDERDDKTSLSSNVIGKQSLENFAEQLGASVSNSPAPVVGSHTARSDSSNSSYDLELSLCMVSVGHGLIFYEGQASEHQIKEHSFFKAFLKFVFDNSTETFDTSFFEWPVFSSAVLRAEQLNHLNEVFSRWAARPEWSSVHYVFYFGYHFDTLERWLLDIKIACDSACVFVPIKISVDEILSAPIKKRSLWETIASLPQK